MSTEEKHIGLNVDWFILHFTVNKKLYFGRIIPTDRICALMVFNEDYMPVNDMQIVRIFTNQFLKRERVVTNKDN